MIKQSKSIAAAILTAGILSLNAFSANTDTQTVTYEVTAINELAVSSPTVSLQVNAATAGGAPTVDTDSSTSYAITTNETNRKITGMINTTMPTGLTLSVTLAAPSGGSSQGKQALTTSPVDLVSSIETVSSSGHTISYELAATAAAGVVGSASKTVTFTLTAED